MGYDAREWIRSIPTHAPQFVSRRKTRGASDLMSMRRVCRRLHDLMGTVPFWIEMCRHRYGFFEVRNEMTPEEVAALEEEKAAAREKAQLEAKAIEEEKERRKVLRERQELRAKTRAERELEKRAAKEKAKVEKQAAAVAAAELAQNFSVSAEPEINPKDSCDYDVCEDEDSNVSEYSDADEAAIPSKIEAVIAYSHSRIVLPTGCNDASWWEKIFFDVSHTGCDHCKAFPMEVFFKCLHCNDVYLCEKCESFHPRTHLMAKVSTPFHWSQPNIRLAPRQAIHTGICSVCASSFGEVLYQCSECDNYKICPSCHQSGSVEHEHTKFWEVVVPDNELYDAKQRGNNPRWASCDGKGSKCIRRCTGINWMCLVCDNYDLCEACERSREFSCRSYSGNRNTHDMTHPLLKILDSKYDTSNSPSDRRIPHINPTPNQVLMNAAVGPRLVDLPDSVIVAIASYVSADTTPLSQQPCTQTHQHTWCPTLQPAASPKCIIGSEEPPPESEDEPAAASRLHHVVAVPSGITPSMVKRLEGAQPGKKTLDDEWEEQERIRGLAADIAPQFVSRRKTRGASDLMSMRRVCRRLHDLMGTVPFWIEMCRHRYGFFEVRNEMTPEEVAALEEEKAVAREKAQLEAKAIEEEKERRKVLRERQELRAKRRELQRRAVAEEQAEREKQAASTAPEMTQNQSQSGEQDSQPSVDTTATTTTTTPTTPTTPETPSGSTGPPRIDPNDPAFPDALVPTISVPEPPDPDDDDEEEDAAVDADESAIPSKMEAVVAYSHSRIVLPTGCNDASWWEKIFFDVSHIGCDHCKAFPMEVFFKCLHCNDVYLCEKCESFHPRTHLMAKVSTPFHWSQPNITLAPAHAIHTGICSVCASSFGEVIYQVRNEMTPEEVAALEEEKAAEREKAQLEAKAIEEEKERRKVLRERQELRAKRRAEREREKRAAKEKAKVEKQAAAVAAAEWAQNFSASTEPEIDPKDSCDSDVSEDQDSDVSEYSDADEAAIPCKIEAVVAYSHSRIVLPTGCNDASWWEKIFFDVSHIGCDHCKAFPMEVFFKCLHCNDVYLCEKCESFHPRTHLMAKVSTPFHWSQPNIRLAPRQAIHTGICSVCASSFGEVIYQCSDCDNYKICPGCHKSRSVEHEHSKFWEVVVPDNELYDAKQRGNNPRWASCDGKGSKCMRRCTGINWMCLVCDNYDLCEACERSREFCCRSYSGNRNTHDMTHPLLKILDSKYDTSKWVLSFTACHF
ncbi:hypothetical protein Pelo_1111 [Pelomyxa schiedti]|nr:hypothetical protein Pelo_1111 [Pelomyxa schiedti]